eukprot:Gregarina_sp_Pseudo_9__3755@NODE_38_length_5294_cov_16_753758_g35_i0_p1_GENE_NODE_38_length_5294_cov_16_753758_g35_i0NODE_38_length_5294_cov_16_753758_g35_i0_p1_ORF_typecomplete_len608_score95_38DAGK_acc/PF00609_19/5_8e22DAGK_cat/PF00781_24/1_5e15_NODE_38_length_5294_cov_16_753758_g35_i017403563
MNAEFELFKDADISTYFFLVVNPRSGGNAAAILLETGFNYFQFHIKSAPTGNQCDALGSPGRNPDTLIKVFISDIRNGTKGNKDVFHIIRHVSLLKEQKRATLPHTDWRVRVMVAGGDGTAMWTFSELQRHSVDPKHVLVGVVPFGTGNDFANATGSHINVQIPNEDPKTMVKRLVSHWITFVAADFDLWNVNVSVNEGGSFAKVDGGTKKKTPIMELSPTGEMRKVTSLEFAMANYCSVGIESRIGVGFDRNRKDNALLNKLAYVMEGVKKTLFHRRRLIDNIVEGLYVRRSDSDECPRVVFQTVAKESRFARAQSVFTRKTTSLLSSQISRGSNQSPSASVSMEMLQTAYGFPVLRPCVSLCVLNIPSFAGGADVWKSSAQRLGLELPARELAQDEATCNKIRHCLPSPVTQDFGDGRLEVVAFHSIAEIGASNIRDGLEKVLPSSLIPTGWRIYRGGGHFELRFRPDLDPSQRIYFQVDGEYYIGYQVNSITVSPDTRIKILVRPDKKPNQDHGRKPEVEPPSEISEDCFAPPDLKQRPSVLLRDVELQPQAPDFERVGDRAEPSSNTTAAAPCGVHIEEDFAAVLSQTQISHTGREDQIVRKQ